MTLSNIFKHFSAAEKERRELNKKLIAAAASGAADEIEGLIDQGADPNAKTSSGTTAAATAVLYINSKNSILSAAQEILQCLAEAGADLTQARETASIQSPALKNFLDQIATPQWWTERLLDAAKSGKPNRIERILSQGVDPNALNEKGVGALRELVDGHNKFMLWNGTVDTTLVLRTRADFLKAAETLVTAGADVTKGGCSLSIRTLTNDALKSFLAAEWEQKVYPRPPAPRPPRAPGN